MASQRMPKAVLRPLQLSSSQSAVPLPHHIVSTTAAPAAPAALAGWLPCSTLFTRYNLTSVPCLKDAAKKARKAPSVKYGVKKARKAPSVKYGITRQRDT